MLVWGVGCMCLTTLVMIGLALTQLAHDQMEGVMMMLSIFALCFVVNLSVLVCTWWIHFLVRRRRTAENQIIVSHALHNFPTYHYSSIESYQSGSGDVYLNSTQTVCCICASDYGVGDEVTRLPCSHCYHKSCIQTWLQRKAECPTCHAVLDVPVLPTDILFGVPLRV